MLCVLGTPILYISLITNYSLFMEKSLYPLLSEHPIYRMGITIELEYTTNNQSQFNLLFLYDNIIKIND